jgi:hypothetical protein
MGDRYRVEGSVQFFSGMMVTNLSVRVFGVVVCISTGTSMGEDDMDAVLSAGWLSVLCVGALCVGTLCSDT